MKDKDRQAVLLTPRNDPEEEIAHDDFTIPRCKYQNTVFGYDDPKRRIKDWNSCRQSHLQS